MPPVTEGGDPRFALSGSEGDVRPVVALPRGGVPTWALIALAVIGGVLLFSILDARRRAASAPAVRPRAADIAAMPASPPPLYVPPDVSGAAPYAAPPAPIVAPVIPVPAPAQPIPVPQPIYVPQPPQMAQPVEPPAPPRVSVEPVLVFDGSAPRETAASSPPGGSADPASAAAAVPGSGVTIGARTRAGVLANPSTTVPQGTLIPAVLETALDSTRPGFARAIVSRDVRGFDGTRVLIPHGSRLIGEYRSEVAPGQRRALVNWVRLIRPDGATISIGSPGSDPLGRAGTNARVNTHFFERFAGAILQSALDIGVNVAAARAGNGAVVVLPGAIQNSSSQVIQPQQVTPTLTVRQATSITIFVARDLDFTGVEAHR